MSLPEALEEAARALPALADAIRPANGDPERLRGALASEQAASVLTWLLAERPVEGEELAEAWAEAPGGAEAVAGVREEELSKAGRKALRRVRHRLRSRGIEVEEAPREPRVATLPELDDRVGGAWISPLDPAGARILYLIEPHPQGGVRLFEAVVDDARGLLGFDVYSAGRKKARAFLRALTERPRFAAVEAPEDAARSLLARAVAAHPADRPLPRGFAEWRSHLAPRDEKTPLPGAVAEEALGARGEPEAAAALVREGRVGPWPPREEVLRKIYERLREALESRVVVSEAAKREQIDGLLEDAATEIFEGEGSRQAAHRLRETAYVLWRGDEEAEARACLAGAAAFEAQEPRANPVARALVEAMLGPALEALARRDEDGEPPPDEEGAADDDAASRLVKP